jgi:hypothetical protein
MSDTPRSEPDFKAETTFNRPPNVDGYGTPSPYATRSSSDTYQFASLNNVTLRQNELARTSQGASMGGQTPPPGNNTTLLQRMQALEER